MFGTDYYRVTITCGGSPVPFMNADYVPKYRSLREICDTVAVHYNIHPHALKRPTRHALICRARHVAMWIAKEITLHSTTSVGRFLGGRDHTTILHGVRKIEELRRLDDKLSDELEGLIAQLGGRP